MAVHDKAVVVDGKFVSQRIAQLVEAIREFSPELDVEYIPEGARLRGEAAFRIIHRPFGGDPYIVFHVKTEAEFDATVLKRLIAGDQRKGAVHYSDIEAAEHAAALVAKQRADDETAEKIDMMRSVLKSPLNTYRVNKDIVIKDGIPFNAKGY